MKIVGDLRNANKFCVETPDRGILWVPSYELARQYTNDPKNTDWYQQTVIATYEQIVRADDGKFYIKSKAPKKTVKQQILDTLETFKNQSKKKIKVELERYAKDKGFDSFLELISFNNSTIKTYKAKAKEALKYRDTIYSYTEDFITKFDEKEIKEAKDISYLYDEYLNNFPFM